MVLVTSMRAIRSPSLQCSITCGNSFLIEHPEMPCLALPRLAEPRQAAPGCYFPRRPFLPVDFPVAFLVPEVPIIDLICDRDIMEPDFIGMFAVFIRMLTVALRAIRFLSVYRWAGLPVRRAMARACLIAFILAALRLAALPGAYTYLAPVVPY